MPKIRVVKINHATRDCTLDKEYDLIRIVPEGEIDKWGCQAAYTTYEFIDDVGDIVSAWGPSAREQTAVVPVTE